MILSNLRNKEGRRVRISSFIEYKVFLEKGRKAAKRLMNMLNP